MIILIEALLKSALSYVVQDELQMLFSKKEVSMNIQTKVKQGITTTEFWLILLSVVGSFLYNYILDLQHLPVDQPVTLGVLAAAAVYAWGRSKVKVASSGLELYQLIQKQPGTAGSTPVVDPTLPVQLPESDPFAPITPAG